MTSPQPILITGASRGLGAAMAEALAGTAPLILVAKTTGALEELDDRIQAKGGQATLAPMDVTNVDAMRHLALSAQERWGGLRAWIHTAVHAAPLMPASDMNEKDWDKSFKLNTRATAAMIPLFAPLMSRESDALFFEDARAGEKFFGAYGASKAAQIALARSWQAEAANIGPRVHILHPAPMPTATRARFYPGEAREDLTPCADEAARLLKEAGLI